MFLRPGTPVPAKPIGRRTALLVRGQSVGRIRRTLCIRSSPYPCRPQPRSQCSRVARMRVGCNYDFDVLEPGRDYPPSGDPAGPQACLVRLTGRPQMA